jgi:hypothetical protein
MSLPEITTMPPAPDPADGEAAFDLLAYPFVVAMQGLPDELNAYSVAFMARYAEVLAIALSGDLPPLAGQALKFLRVNAGETAAEFAAAQAFSANLTAALAAFTLPEVDGTGGQVIVTNGAGVTSWANLPLSKSYVSAEQTITSSGQLVLAHGFGVAPKLLALELVCKVAQHGYSIGDVVSISGSEGTAPSSDTGIGRVLDATNVTLRFGGDSSTLVGTNKSNGNAVTFTNASWRLVVRAWA